MAANAFGYHNKQEEGTGKKGNSLPEITAGCAPAAGATKLDINNTNTLILTGGDLWWDFQNPRYEIPKGSGQHSIFAGALWMGGVDVSNQLKVAGQRYRGSGNDYWPGPLSTKTFEIDAETCVEYDKHFVTTRDEIEKFVGWYQCGQDSDCSQAENYAGYTIPDIILEWPAHGRNYDPYNEDFNLAPFYDRNGDGIYNPLDGDYPGYDLFGESDCSERVADIYGDQNLWWVFNDKGNVHTETGSQAIGMEVRAQAFAFATSDEVNNMTFYNFEMINRSTFTLKDTYFGVFVDADLGFFDDDYVGCDVTRGLAYCYNGDAFDEDAGGATGYGDQPPAIGVDYFQGPFQDNDEIDNAVGIGENEALKGNGVGYGDGVVDNERFGMRRFVYFDRQGPACCNDPTTGVQYYNYLQSKWKDGTKMVYGGNGHVANPGVDPNVLADFMFPDDTDPLGWGTIDKNTGQHVIMPPWNEVTAGNSPLDRRFIQSSGPFTLAPGATNYITLGVVWARAASGGNWASVQTVRRADDKTQAMFDNCFQTVDGPDAPDMDIQELNRELILYISNSATSNNFNEEYTEIDGITFIPPDSVDTNNDGIKDLALTQEEKDESQTYYFEGYQIFQLRDETVSPVELKDPNKARLVAQCDIKNNVTQIINYYEDEELPSYIPPIVQGALVPIEEVNGEDKGIRHSFKITDDAFAFGDRRLINHKSYYYMAIAYGYNYSPYNFFDPAFDEDNAEFKQKKPYLPSRKAATGSIKVFAGIPHKTDPEAGGTVINSQYGDGFELTRIEGRGNGGLIINMKQESIDQIMKGEPWKVDRPVYIAGQGPVDIKVIDPLNIPQGSFNFVLKDSVAKIDYDGAYWELTFYGADDSKKTITADKTIDLANEQIIPEWGISVTIGQVDHPKPSSGDPNYGDAFLDGTMTFADESKRWITGIPDTDGETPQNWIRSGTATTPQDWSNVDSLQVYENVLGGTWAPYKLCASSNHGSQISSLVFALNKIERLESVDIFITSDKSKWTRCPVIETQEESTLSEEGATLGFLRRALSLDKDGNIFDTTGYAAMGYSIDSVPASTNPDAPNYIGGYGMGWFPGYAISIETGERLNMAFGEDSWLQKENGRDMLWNPTGSLFEGPFDDIRLGGKHYIFVFRNNLVEDNISQGVKKPEDRMPLYDYGQFAFDVLDAANGSAANTRNVWRATSWCGLPLLEAEHTLLETDVTIQLRMAKPYEGYGTATFYSVGDNVTDAGWYFVDKGPIGYKGEVYERGDYLYIDANTTFTDSTATATTRDLVDNIVSTLNAGRPMYAFNSYDLATIIGSQSTANDALDLINVVPNPYYAYSSYETDKLDNRIKITNLPDRCDITIYTTSGVVVRRFSKADPTITSLDWDLKNQANIPISSGIYIIHVEVPDVGEKIFKWFGMLRPIDLDAF
ncbi:MAG: hypothetical protein COA57_15955 [Flavobacteriales bacterium]|nr:MAG: hypothetical protein COA57_15955 [Flavobacteriales bacterium]